MDVRGHFMICTIKHRAVISHFISMFGNIDIVVDKYVYILIK